MPSWKFDYIIYDSRRTADDPVMISLCVFLVTKNE